MKTVWWLALPILLTMAIAYWAWSSHESAMSKVGLLGSMASIWGIVIAFWQVADARRTAANAQTASGAALAASKATERKLRNMYYRDSLHTAHRFLAEIRAAIDGRIWQFAAGRARDLSEQSTRLAYVRRQTDDEWLSITDSLAAWAIIFDEGKQRKPLDFAKAEWAELYIFVNDKIERELDPFGEE
ncbi:MAG TPA: hypothetical protein VF278_16950 [Pirellulales bacterium]